MTHFMGADWRGRGHPWRFGTALARHPEQAPRGIREFVVQKGAIRGRIDSHSQLKRRDLEG